MSTWIALLRGINVGANRALPMNDLSRTFEDLGCSDVTTYLRSGNVVFNAHIGNPRRFGERVSNAIQHTHGFEPVVLMLQLEELRDAAACNPYPDAISDPKSLHLFFLEEEPAGAFGKSLDQLKSATESYSLSEKVFYLHAPDGVARSRLAGGLEKVLQVNTTARNWRTVARLVDLARGIVASST